ncbi:MAG: ABC transporter permease [Oscillospiraceae bacterium]|nr:ABC transporter permease [Oscillospiraceae bacterium]
MKSKLPAVPYLVWMAVFIVVPVGFVVYFAFTTPEGQFTLENISRVGQYANVLFRSIWLACIATVICLLIAYPLAYIIARSGASIQKTLIMLVMLPMWMNFLLRTYAWMTLLENSGIINNLLRFFGLGPVQMINTPGAVVLGMVYNYLPFMILPLHSIMVKISDTTLEAASDLGANAFQTFRRVVLPLSIPGIMTGITMVFVPSISTFIISRMLGGGGNILIGDLIELQFIGGNYNPNLGSAISLVLLVIVLLCMSIFNQVDTSDKEGIV